VRISVIIPTIWRSTLNRAVKSAVQEARKGDQIIIVGDGLGLWDDPLWDSPRPAPGVLIIVESLPERVGDYGCSACDHGIEIASGDYVFFLGDDDYLAPGAFDTIRRGIAEEPGVPHLFAMQHGYRILEGSLECGEVSGQQIVVPRDMAKMPKMRDFAPGELMVSDWSFIKRVEEAWGKIVMHDEVIAILPKMNQGRML